MENTPEKLRVYNRMKSTKVLGPGNRYALWLQGCDKNCAKCMTPSSRSHHGGTLMEVKHIFDEIASLNAIEGITISGGEPFLQFNGLYSLLQRIKTETNLSVIIYTGFYLNELLEKKEERIDRIIQQLSDILIDGPYMDELNDGYSLRGSSNQNIHMLSNRYADVFGRYYNISERKAEIHLSDKEAFLVGIPDKNGYDMWKNIFENKNKG